MLRAPVGKVIGRLLLTTRPNLNRFFSSKPLLLPPPDGMVPVATTTQAPVSTYDTTTKAVPTFTVTYRSTPTSYSSYSYSYPANRTSEFYESYIPFYSSSPNYLAKLIEAIERLDIEEIKKIAVVADYTLVTKQTGLGDTPLHRAAKKGNSKVIRALADAFYISFDVNKRCSRGKTPLFDAINSGNIDAVKELFLLKANPNIVIDGETALDTAISINSPKEIIHMICDHNGTAQRYVKEMEEILEKRTIEETYADFLVSSKKDEEKMLDQNLSTRPLLTTGK